jgi:hypothetical protein
MGSEWILERLAGGGSSWLRIEADGGLFKYGDEPAGSGATELLNPLKPSGNYMYHLLVTNQLLCILHLWVVHESRCKQRLFP